jgi:hypothetical protein
MRHSFFLVFLLARFSALTRARGIEAKAFFKRAEAC